MSFILSCAVWLSQLPHASVQLVDGGAARSTSPDAGGPVIRSVPSTMGPATDGGRPPLREAHAVRAYDPTLPSTWRLRDQLSVASSARLSLVRALTDTSSGLAGKPLTATEVDALLADPRAQLVYGDKTVAVVTPSQPAKHRQEHVDLLKILLTPERLEMGRAFRADYRETLEGARTAYQVDPEVIVSILMWESKLGTVTGLWNAFNVLASQAFFVEQANTVALRQMASGQSFDRVVQQKRVATIQERAFRNLVVLVRVCKAQAIDPLDVKGSWAGAIGFPQFMPASLSYAADGDGDGKIDLNNFADAIFSIARYLSEHGYAQSPTKAVYAYNHEQAYVDGVLGYAGELDR